MPLHFVMAPALNTSRRIREQEKNREWWIRHVKGITYTRQLWRLRSGRPTLSPEA